MVLLLEPREWNAPLVPPRPIASRLCLWNRRRLRKRTCSGWAPLHDWSSGHRGDPWARDEQSLFCRWWRRCGLSQGYSSTTGLALQRSTSLPVITFPLMTHPTWELRLAGSLNRNRRIFWRCCASVFFMPFAPRFCKITSHQLNDPTLFFVHLMRCFSSCYSCCRLRSPAQFYSQRNPLQILKNNLISLLFAASHTDPLC